jgi:CRISPR/Cas system-associated protein Cas5 (RAMP superfamily)
MVILETALIGAAGYGAYRGGEESVRKGKEAKQEFQREQKRRTKRNELSTKSKNRQERIAKLALLRGGNSNSLTQSDTSWPLSGSSTRTTSVSTSESSDLDNRQKAIMDKMKVNKKKEKSSGFSIFKKKK